MRAKAMKAVAKKQSRRERNKIETKRGHSRLSLGEGGCVALDFGVAHPATEVRVDGEDEGLDEEATVEGSGLEVDLLRRIVDGGLAGLWETGGDVVEEETAVSDGCHF